MSLPRRGKKTPELLRGLLARVQGTAEADAWATEYERLNGARMRTQASRAEALEIAAAQRAAGTANADEPAWDMLAANADAKRARIKQAEESARNPRAARIKQEYRTSKKMRSRMDKRLKGRMDAERKAAEEMAEKAFKKHGIRHHYRAIPKTAWFAVHMASYDRDGLLMLEALASCNMPAWRMAQVLSAAANPQGYEIRRDVCRGKREGQTAHVFDGRTFGPGTARRNDWHDGQRLPSHPGFQRVVGCAVFMWMGKSLSRKRGAMHLVHGFGRGVFETMLRCDYSAIFGHDDGMPGAMVALRAVGFCHYHQPPADEVAEIDRGPKGHAYNKYWLPTYGRDDAMTEALADARELLAEMGREALPEHWRRAVAFEPDEPDEPDPPDQVAA